MTKEHIVSQLTTALLNYEKLRRLQDTKLFENEILDLIPADAYNEQEYFFFDKVEGYLCCDILPTIELLGKANAEEIGNLVLKNFAAEYPTSGYNTDVKFKELYDSMLQETFR